MAIGVALVKGPSGQSGPNAVGEFAEEIYELTGDNVATSVAVPSQWLRQIDAAFGTQAINTVINNTVSPPTATLTFAVAPLTGAKSYLAVRGRR